jgi:plastocyanin domain-containing protein
MRPDQVAVTVAGLGAIAWITWYFFYATARSVRASPAGAGAQEITITVDGGYAPSLIDLEAGRPARLHFDRKDSGSCTEEVVFPDFGIRRFLPTGTTTTIELTPRQPGSYEFACGMGMVRGKLHVHR